MSGVLERATPHSSAVEPEELDQPSDPTDVEPAATPKGRGAAPKKPKGIEARTARRIKGRTIYLPDDLFERILVQAHRRGRTISEYVTGVLERQVPDYRTLRVDPAETERAD